MLVLAVTGLVAGVLVSERRLAEAQLRANQNALSQLSRLGSMGELAATIAHEINQPLSAAKTYTGLVAESLQTESLRDASTVEMANKAAIQIGRAADVVRRLRALVRMGRSDLVPTSVTRIVQEAAALARPDLEPLNVTLKMELSSDLPPVMADRLQVEQVLVNLIRNAAESIAGAGSGKGQIMIAAELREPHLLQLSVSDSGPGFPLAFGGGAPPPLQSSKPDGLGIGLSLCRSIAEAHGGELSIRSGRDGATVAITLPIAEGMRNA
jgi:C4-dicarboxylate-specific signal transduction histidine kinase